MGLEERLRYFRSEGVTVAMLGLGWKERPSDDTLVFKKTIGKDVELVVFRKSKALTRREVIECLDNTRGISFKEFEEAYVKAYSGDPPLMSL